MPGEGQQGTKGSYFQSFSYAFLGTILCLGLLEGLLRIAGQQAFQINAAQIESHPDWSLCPHPTLGIGLNPGFFSVNINQGLNYTCTHQADSTRATKSNADSTSASFEKKVFFYGCSFTYGMGVSDSATFAYQVQSALPEWAIYNYGVPAYGTIQSLLQLKRHLSSNSLPDLIFLNYSSLHDARNKLSPTQQKHWQEAFGRADVPQEFSSANFPYVADINAPTLAIEYLRIPEMKKRWSWSYASATSHTVEVIYDHILDGFQAKQIISQKIILDFARQCQLKNIPLIVTGMTNDKATKQMLDFCRSNNIATLDFEIDIQDPAFNLQPYDSHPNEYAHQIYAEQLVDYIQEFNN